ncbi:hypothetical protein CSUI_006884 [Cystoisospora suis]|uniref:Uncharacterized protein n=1 Tax=Cystoisospora suis TaxID=483139 RepID=A0A2C6KQ86_9APIC|nr:hypothetical protein CSUI_006884 [Cystoisospora suis]
MSYLSLHVEMSYLSLHVEMSYLSHSFFLSFFLRVRLISLCVWMKWKSVSSSQEDIPFSMCILFFLSISVTFFFFFAI